MAFTPGIVQITTPSQSEAEILAKILVEEGLAACCSVLDNVSSYYRWEGSLQHDEECLLLCKTSAENFPGLRDKVLGLHSYDVPEILFTPVTAGSESYLAWMNDVMSRGKTGKEPVSSLNA